MAVLPAHPGIQVTVVCNGAPLQEYDDDDAEDPNGSGVFKYIEAISGAEFGVRFEITPPWPVHAILFQIWLDQKRQRGFFCRLDQYRDGGYIKLDEGAQTVVDGKAYVHKFAFTALDVDDSAPAVKQLAEDIEGMGEVTVKAFFVKNLRSKGMIEKDLVNQSKELGKIPEKSLKGRSLSHQTSLRAPQATGKSFKVYSHEHVDSTKSPFATYTFKYRSRDALKSLLIIPRTPSPVPLEERDVDALSAEEMRQLLHSQRERDAAARAVKQERGIKREHTRDRSGTYTDDADDEISIVSTKRRREHYRTTVDERGVEVIDLT